MIFARLIDGGEVVILVKRKRQTQRNVILKQSDYIFWEGQELAVQTKFFLSFSEFEVAIANAKPYILFGHLSLIPFIPNIAHERCVLIIMCFY